ncbi:MAG: dicarboxylate/amino acid:cation symporter, partial [Pseudomonadota bacterium]
MQADKLTRRVFIGLIAGVFLGLLGNFLINSDYTLLQNIWQLINVALVLIGKWFIAGLKMIVVPLVFLSLVCGISHGNQQSLGRLSAWTFALYIAMTVCAITIALTVSNISQPGQGVRLGNTEYQPASSPSVMDTLASLIPANPFLAMTQGDMLQIIIFALLFGLALKKYGVENQRLLTLFNDLNGVILKLVNMIMAFAPIGVFALVTTVMAQQGLKIILPLANYFLTIIIVLMIQLFVVYGSMLKIVGKVSPSIFFSKVRDLSLFAFSTASSAATIPVTFKTVEEKLGVDRDISSFTIPLGATVGMDGTAIMQGVAVVFIAGA